MWNKLNEVVNAESIWELEGLLDQKYEIKRKGHKGKATSIYTHIR